MSSVIERNSRFAIRNRGEAICELRNAATADDGVLL